MASADVLRVLKEIINKLISMITESTKTKEKKIAIRYAHHNTNHQIQEGNGKYCKKHAARETTTEYKAN